MVNAIFAYQKTGGVNITMQNGHLPPLQIYSWVLTILQHIYRGQICENQFFVQCTSVTSLLLVRTSTVTTVSKKVTMITSSYYLLLWPLRWKALYFRLSRINILDLNILHLQIIFTCLPPVKPRDIAFISSILMGVQKKKKTPRSLLGTWVARNCNASDKQQQHVPSIPPLFSYI